MNSAKKTGRPQPKNRVNGDIRCREVRLIGEDNETIGVMPTVQALRMAEEAGVDLVEISPNAEPPVCRLIEYGKYLYEKSKDQKKKKQKVVQIKEIKFRPGTDEGDYQVKLRNLIRFLEEGNKAKVTLRFRGREMAHQHIGLDVLKRVEHDLCEEKGLATVESASRVEGRQATMVLAPKKK
ncbi:MULTISPECIES: translation initiation factor IF-3 [unclassified Anaerobiospirillum]|uniref:translation initiation factor IF-3 n=1 Tax=unclassified Anaerobiospirillum TaxID=2647410 RepID=UPI001FF2D82E|nr:translation initiation factor IF-3 [Anaerobiospirillum sp. NML120449]MCK0535839.1 translation initiation factor IF-3 [Anaerobiospirillum sp. NML120511]MCK0540997.1 translation initiation factor IF-3 [Anaerobiospirillum sp. NML02-A-032]